MTESEKRILSKIWDFMFGLRITESEIEFQIFLEDKFLSLKDGESLFYYFDYNPMGNLQDLISSWETVKNKKLNLWLGGVNKTGLKVYRDHGELFAEVKKGYGQNWIRL